LFCSGFPGFFIFRFSWNFIYQDIVVFLCLPGFPHFPGIPGFFDKLVLMLSISSFPDFWFPSYIGHLGFPG
jgi:hypothetical protein